ncbi:MAG: hypothetical protein R3D71_07380 [Rickettsiales bacterium]
MSDDGDINKSMADKYSGKGPGNSTTAGADFSGKEQPVGGHDTHAKTSEAAGKGAKAASKTADGFFAKIKEAFTKGQEGKAVTDSEHGAKKAVRVENMKTELAKSGLSDEAKGALEKKISHHSDRLNAARSKTFSKNYTIAEGAAARIGANFGPSANGFEKGMRGTGAVIGAVYAGNKVLNPERDDEGKVKWASTIAKTAAGAAVAALALAAGGKNRAMGI